MKTCHDEKIEMHEFVVGDILLLFNSRLRLFLGKLKSMWNGPYRVTQVFQHGTVKLENKEKMRFKVKGQRIKVYLRKYECVGELINSYYPDEVGLIKVFSLFRDVN